MLKTSTCCWSPCYPTPLEDPEGAAGHSNPPTWKTLSALQINPIPHTLKTLRLLLVTLIPPTLKTSTSLLVMSFLALCFQGTRKVVWAGSIQHSPR